MGRTGHLQVVFQIASKAVISIVFSHFKFGTAIPRRKEKMNNLILKLRSLIEREEGQDLVEYALVVALIAFGAVTAMKGLSSEINTAFMTISSDLASSL
jgi:pilus assembly protein Flp/PilA